MPENPNIEQDTDFDGFYGSNITMATTANNSQNRKQSAAPRVSSAGIKYYDIATQLLGKNGSDLEELFIAAARVSCISCCFKNKYSTNIYHAKTLITER